MQLPETITITRDCLAEIAGAPVGHGVDLVAGEVYPVIALSVHGRHWHIEHDGRRLIVARCNTSR